jgi:hypothetical protein
MSSIKYNPNPARVWSRVQNRCSTDTADSNVDYAKIDYDRQMLLKGNILQYKKNSSNLTKNQRYTQIAKGMWTNRTKTWATQSDTYTNPNNSSLLRVNYTILDPSNNTFSSRSNPFNCPTTEIQDGGNLVCNVVVNPCTQEVIKRSVSQQLCNPTTDSDVPGQIQQLCWNDGTQTWYPRQRYTMGNSGTSWPEGYKGFVSALTQEPPVLTLESSDNNSVTLSWTAISNDCMPISSFNIYQNGILIGNVLYPIHTITLSNLCGSYSFYVTSLSSDIESQSSNIVSYSNATNAPTNLSLTYNDPNSIDLTWSPVSNANSYNIYQIGIGLIFNTSSTNATISIICGLSSFYVTSLNNSCESEPSEPVSYTNTINAPTGLSYSTTSTVNQIILSWSSVSNATYYNVYKNGISYQISYTNSITISNLCGTNNFTVTAGISGTVCESEPSNITTFVATRYTTTGTITYSGSYTYVTFLNNGSITFICPTNIQYTLVGGGASGGGYDPAGTGATGGGGLCAGGGGHVLTTTSDILINTQTPLNISIGQGGILPESPETSPGVIGSNTSISSGYSDTTNNTTYSGGGGNEGSKSNYYHAYKGGGGTGSNGGAYINTNNYPTGPGGGGGALSNQNSSQVTLGYNGNNGGNGTNVGYGGNGQIGINGNTYGGGGGGGGNSNGGSGKGIGGTGGGGDGAGYNFGTFALPGTPNTGGGGGGGYYSGTNSVYKSANGGSGIAIIRFLT